MRIQALIFASCATAFAEIVEYSLSKEECQAAGFNPETLKCSTCKQLTEFNLDFLMTDCESCCTKDQDDEHEKYPVAHIEVCECNLGRFPQVQAFVREDMASKWGGKVRVRHVRGVRPQIKLKDDSGITRQTMNIEKWDTDTISDFLDQWLQ